jgi:hypothetical protein
MSSDSAMTILPQSARKLAAPCMPRHTSVRGTPGANCRKITGRMLLSGSCSTTRRIALIDSWSRRCDRNIGS